MRADRFRGLPLATVAGIEVPVAITPRSRLLGLALLDRDQAGPGLLLPRCRSVHTAGMRFPLQLRFVSRDGKVVSRFPAVAPWRLAYCPAAVAVLETPVREGCCGTGPYHRRAMAMTNAELIKRSLESFNNRDGDAMVALQHPEIEFVPITAALDGSVYRTPEETREFLRSLDLDWEFYRAIPETFYEVGDRALAFGTVHARGRGSQVEIPSQQVGWFITSRDGLIDRWRTYTDPNEALEAIGLSEEELAEHQVYPP